VSDDIITILRLNMMVPHCREARIAGDEYQALFRYGIEIVNAPHSIWIFLFRIIIIQHNGLSGFDALSLVCGHWEKSGGSGNLDSIL